MKTNPMEAHGKTAEDDAATVPAVSEEELFCDYLAARTQQALDTLNAAREDLVAKPQDLNRAMDVMRKVYELRDLKKQLELQRDRVNVARAAAGLPPGADDETLAPPAFRAAQAEHAAKIMAALAVQPRTCPSCQTPILSNATHCRCGQALGPAPAGAASALSAVRDPTV